MIPRAEMADTRPHRLDDSRALVAEDDRERNALPAPVGRVEAAVADAAGDHADEHLALARGLHLELLDAERGALLEQDRGLHAPPRAQPPWRTRGFR